MNAEPSLSFFEELRVQRWDDHRYYHQSRVNQSLHLFSACCFLVTYALIPFNPLAAALLGWVVAMWMRQIGHFFFEPTGFDTVNNVSFEEKENIKVGFNLQRKVVLLAVWLAVPAVTWALGTKTGMMPTDTGLFMDRVGQGWIGLALAGLLARTVYLMVTRSFQTGAVWFTKIITDPINDIRTYYQSPLYLLKGQLYDPMDHVAGQAMVIVSATPNDSQG
jgi:hypothetical protein